DDCRMNAAVCPSRLWSTAAEASSPSTTEASHRKQSPSMYTRNMSSTATIRTQHGSSAAWTSWLGIVAIVLGLLLTADHGTEWTKQAVMAGATPADGRLPAAECPEDELIEEGLTLEECEQLVSEVRSFIASAPEWFPGAMTAIAAIG